MNPINRRQFLGSVAAAGLASRALGQTAPAGGPPIKIGLIGCGGYGNSQLAAAFEAGGVEVVALCDVDAEHLRQTADTVAARQTARPQTFKNYQELIDVPGLQVVFIATPTHWHALPFIAACNKGLDVYCEKPLAYDPREGRAMIEAARKHDRIVQVGFQRRNSDVLDSARKYIAEGRAGRIVQTEVQIHYEAPRTSRTPEDPPASLDWDAWCGPAPKLPYSPAVGHVRWRLEKTTGNGHLVDWGIHLVDAARTILGESLPKSVTAVGGLYQMKEFITTPDALTVQFDYPACPIIWRHRIWGAAEYAAETAQSIFFYGEKETVFYTDDVWMAIPKGGQGPTTTFQGERSAKALNYHMADFLNAVRTRKQPACPIEDGYRTTLAVQLAMLAYETRQPVAWDADAEQITNNPAAQALLKREYRAPYQHPYTG